jgi:8-oxo-dGTP pyrophosphatase MutT (NUDIX family)
MDPAAQHDSTKPEPQPVVAAIVTSEHGVLIGRRNDGKPPWTFIAGEIEPGESPADAGVREVKEETGLLVAAGREIGRRVHPATGRTMIYMAAKPTHGTDIFVGDRNELAEVRWVALAEAEQLMHPYGMFGPVREHLAKLPSKVGRRSGAG